MPYGLPGAMKLRHPVAAVTWDAQRPLLLQSGAVLEPLHPGADQDGWNGEWCVRLHKTGDKVAVDGDELRRHL